MQYKLRVKGSNQWTGWTDHLPGESFDMDLDRYDMAEWRDTPRQCTAKAPFEVEGVGRAWCNSNDVTECVETGTHSFELTIGNEDNWGDCYHSRTITWSALNG